MEQEWYFYIVKCKDNTYYSGITNDVDHRIEKHNKGTGAKYTSGRLPVKLVYREKCPDESAARKREFQIKRWPRTKKEQLIKGILRHRPE